MKGLARGDRALSASVSYPAKARRYRPLGPSPAGQAHGLKIGAVRTGEERPVRAPDRDPSARSASSFGKAVRMLLAKASEGHPSLRHIADRRSDLGTMRP